MNDKTILGSLINALSGTCRFCACHGDSCRLEDGEKCCWVDQFKTLCSNPSCTTAAHYAKKHSKRDRARAARARVTA